MHTWKQEIFSSNTGASSASSHQTLIINQSKTSSNCNSVANKRKQQQDCMKDLWKSDKKT